MGEDEARAYDLGVERELGVKGEKDGESGADTEMGGRRAGASDERKGSAGCDMSVV